MKNCSCTLHLTYSVILYPGQGDRMCFFNEILTLFILSSGGIRKTL